MINSIMMVSIGGALGCLLRWWLGIALNAFFPYLPLGTLAANCLAGYFIGIAVAIFVVIPVLLPWRLFIITGFLGGLSTFSSFSAEVVLSGNCNGLYDEILFSLIVSHSFCLLQLIRMIR